jgi:hypothetical protein
MVIHCTVMKWRLEWKGRNEKCTYKILVSLHVIYEMRFRVVLYEKGRPRGSSVSIVTRLRAGRPEFYFWHGEGHFLSATAFRPALVSTQPPIQWVPRVKRSGREAYHSPSSSAEVKNAWSCTSTAPVRLHCVMLSYAVYVSSWLKFLDIMEIGH